MRSERDRLMRFIFFAFDNDASGELEVTELRRALNQLGLQETSDYEIMQKYDRDRSGKIDLGEFINLMSDPAFRALPRSSSLGGASSGGGGARKGPAKSAAITRSLSKRF